MTKPCSNCGTTESKESPNSKDSKYFECIACKAQFCINCGSNGQPCPDCGRGYLSLRRRML